MYVVYIYSKEESQWIYDILSAEEVSMINPKDIGKIWDLGKERKVTTTIE